MPSHVPSLAFLTPVDPHRPHWLDETATSIGQLREHLATDVDWHVVTDGPMTIPADTAWARSADTITVLAHRAGIAACRNIALSLADTNWVMPLDADDTLCLAGPVLKLPETLAGLDEDLVALAGSQLGSDGTPTRHEIRQSCRYERHALAERWTIPMPLHPNTIVIRRAAALAAGGWPAVPVNEDAGFAMMLNTVGAILAVPRLFLTHYRTHPGQTTADPDYPAGKSLSFRVIEDLVNARRTVDGYRPIRRPEVHALRTGPYPG